MLVGGSGAQYALPPAPGPVSAAVEKMIRHLDGLPAREKEACASALKAVQTAHKKRHEPVHTDWLLVDGKWHQVPRDEWDILGDKQSRPARPEREFQRSIDEMVFAGRRAAAMSRLVTSVTQTDYRKEGEGDLSVSPYRAIWLLIAGGDHDHVPIGIVDHLDKTFLGCIG